MYSKTGEMAKSLKSMPHAPCEKYQEKSRQPIQFLWEFLFRIQLTLGFSARALSSLWPDRCCKAKGKWGGCASTKLDDTREHEKLFIIVQKSNYAYLSFCISLYAAHNAAFYISAWRERVSGFEGNRCLSFLWGMLFIFLLAFLQTTSLSP